jgi:hypothetical protein
MPEKVTSIGGEREYCAYKRISLEYSNTWPGQVYLRFEPWDDGPQAMIRVMPGDIVSISQLANPYVADEEVRNMTLHDLACMRPEDREALLSKHRHPSSW